MALYNNGADVPSPQEASNGFSQPSASGTWHKGEEEVKVVEPSLVKKAHREILDHERKRRVELKCMELQEMMEEQGYSEEEIRQKVGTFRQMLMEKEGVLTREDQHGRQIELWLWHGREPETCLGDHPWALGWNCPSWSDTSDIPQEQTRGSQWGLKRRSSSSTSPPPKKKKKKKSGHRRSRKKRKPGSEHSCDSSSPIRKEKKKKTGKKHRRDRSESGSRKKRRHRSRSPKNKRKEKNKERKRCHPPPPRDKGSARQGHCQAQHPPALSPNRPEMGKAQKSFLASPQPCPAQRDGAGSGHRGGDGEEPQWVQASELWEGSSPQRIIPVPRAVPGWQRGFATPPNPGAGSPAGQHPGIYQQGPAKNPGDAGAAAAPPWDPGPGHPAGLCREGVRGAGGSCLGRVKERHHRGRPNSSSESSAKHSRHVSERRKSPSPSPGQRSSSWSSSGSLSKSRSRSREKRLGRSRSRSPSPKKPASREKDSEPRARHGEPDPARARRRSRSYSPIRKRRRDSPSFMEPRRITRSSLALLPPPLFPSPPAAPGSLTTWSSCLSDANFSFSISSQGPSRRASPPA
ncbi:Serine/arginine repetitive matrix protein 3, partial [Chaetura pelagica]